MATDKQETTDPYEQIQPGDHVKHAKFGQGQILHRTGSGDETKLVVSFAEEGEKRLLAKYAKLKKVRPIEPAKESADAADDAADGKCDAK
jgi:PcrA/UvrD tudor domain